MEVISKSCLDNYNYSVLLTQVGRHKDPVMGSGSQDLAEYTLVVVVGACMQATSQSYGGFSMKMGAS